MVLKPKRMKKVTPKQEVKKFAGDVLPSVGEMSAKAEMMLMGFTIAMDSNDKEINRTEMIWYTTYILSVLRQNTPADNLAEANEVYDSINRYSSNLVKHITVNTSDGMVMITYTLKSGREAFPKDLDTRDGIFSYVYNVSCPEFSELGYTFYEKRAGTYHRIG